MSEMQHFPTLPSQPFRLDVPLHELLQQPAHKPSPDPATLRDPKTLPAAVFPQYPELFHELDEQDIAAHDAVLRTGKRHWPASNVMKTMRGWMFPYFKSRVLPGDFQPIIAYLFTEWKCNLDCHYCWSYDNRIKGMTEDTARRAIDWLESTPCRVLAPTGGEPLIRPDFVHKVVYYAAKKDFWVYLATNARLLRPEVTDHLADAGIATVNFAVDTIKEKPGLPKAFEHVGCRAGQNWLIIRTNGTLAPCFPMYNASYDWGTVANQKFDVKQLSEMKKGCEPNCFSTLGYNVAYCYSAARVMKWLWKQAMNGFQGVTGSFE